MSDYTPEGRAAELDAFVKKLRADRLAETMELCAIRARNGNTAAALRYAIWAGTPRRTYTETAPIFAYAHAWARHS